MTGMERVISVAGGALLLSKGLRKGGLFGLISLAMGGAAIYRGMTGHCEMKKKMMQKMG
ncbi:YgaP-like transmembrane domain [Pseudomonas saliphila]|uniref:YgaP-like transmembrane domain n=1 Tax=Pseudomonas saliphila TaxID=2586906 RepID=UPI0022A8BC46|nr:YgaP-like transmembrane domain [Pseudomonas saliphila]